MQTITTDQLKVLREASGGALALINTLPEDQFQATRIPGAHHVPLESSDFVERVERLAGGRTQPVVVYCASSECPSSHQAAQQLTEAGFADVWHYEGGAQAWQEAGEKLEPSTG
jgi:rhodanese-related sulfurtransferase